MPTPVQYRQSSVVFIRGIGIILDVDRGIALEPIKIQKGCNLQPSIAFLNDL
jgi:hypothetical protein